MNRDSVVIIGSGGHAKVIIELFRSEGKFTVAGCVSPDTGLAEVIGAPILGDDGILPEILAQGIRHAFIAVGENKVRAKLATILSGFGFKLPSVISPFTQVSPTASIGQGVAIMAGVVVNASASIGDNAILNSGATIDHDCIIGKDVHIAPGCNIAGNVEIGDGAFLGVGCRVIPRIKIGEWSVVGAGTTVVRNIPAKTMAYGVPGRNIRAL